MVEYSWEVLSLYVSPSQDGLNNVIKKATWRFQAKDGSYAADLYKDTLFDSPNPDDFINYSGITHDVVVEWIKSKENLNELTNIVNEKLENLKNPTRIIEKEKPWDPSLLYSLDDIYVLFSQGKLIRGPNLWNSNYFNSGLEQVNLDRSFPDNIHIRQRKILPVDEPLVIDSDTNTILYKCEILNSQPDDSVFHKNDYIVWNFNVWPITGTYEVVDRDLDYVKQKLIFNTNNAYIKSVSDTDLFIEINEKQYCFHIPHQANIVDYLYILNDNETILFEFLDSEFCEVNKTQLKFMLDKIVNCHKLLLEKKYNIISSIKNSESVSSLKNIKVEI